MAGKEIKKSKLSEHETWCDDATRQADILFGLKAKGIEWTLKTLPSGMEVCNWKYVLAKGTIGGSFAVDTDYAGCLLSLATGIGLEMHPFRATVSQLLNYLGQVAHSDSKRNMLGEIAVRGWVLNVMAGNTDRDLALNRLIRDFRMRDNIDEMYILKVSQKGIIH
jgi:hypothetical protein